MRGIAMAVVGGLLCLGCASSSMVFVNPAYEGGGQGFTTLGIAPVWTGTFMEESLIDRLVEELVAVAKTSCGFARAENLRVPLDTIRQRFAAGATDSAHSGGAHDPFVCADDFCPGVILVVEEFSLNMDAGTGQFASPDPLDLGIPRPNLVPSSRAVGYAKYTFVDNRLRSVICSGIAESRSLSAPLGIGSAGMGQTAIVEVAGEVFKHFPAYHHVPRDHPGGWR